MNEIPDYKPRWWEKEEEKEPYYPQPKRHYLGKRLEAGAIVIGIIGVIYGLYLLYTFIF